jgi:hypothetical protein
MKIFVQMVSYRGEASNAMRDCIENSSNKDNIYFGVCLQQDEQIPPELNHERIKVSKVDWSQSQGPGWALKQAQNFYEGQEYTMLVDSRTRFEKNWDEKLISALESTGSKKPIITNQPGKFDPANGVKESTVAYRPSVYQLLDSPLVWPINMKNINSIVKNNWISSFFFFTRGSHCIECPYDPDIYYSEIEANITLRSYTAGYDIFSHYEPIVWKDYSQCKMNWQDDSDWWIKDRISKDKLKSLLKGELTEFGLGSSRSLKDFEIYSGIDLANGRINKTTLAGNPPPYKFENETQWESEYQKDYNLIAKWDINEIEKCDDYDYWYFSIEDEQDATLYRYDLRPERDADVFSFKVDFRRVVFKCPWNKTPKKVCVWPVSKSKGWLKKSKFEL